MPADKALILGGGIVGLACALRLQDQGLKVSLIDPDEPGPASFGNAGHIAVEQAAPLASPRTVLEAPTKLFAVGGPLDMPLSAVAAWGPFAARLVAASHPKRFVKGKAALAAWLEEAMPAWRRLSEALGADDLLLENGHFVVWQNARAAAKGAAAWKRMNTSAAAFRPASRAELEEIANRLQTPIAGAIRFERSGQITDLTKLLRTLRTSIEAHGGMFIRARATKLLIENAKASAITGDGRRHEADLILVAAGVASGRLMEDVGHCAPIIAERGYHIEAAPDRWPAFPPIVFEDRSVVATRFAKALRLTSFAEFSRADAPPDPRKWRRLRKHAGELGIAFSEPVREWMGSRPTFPDYLPAVGRSARADNLLYAFGHQHLGLTLAPTTAEVIAALACGRLPEPSPTPFDLARFDKV